MRVTLKPCKVEEYKKSYLSYKRQYSLSVDIHENFFEYLLNGGVFECTEHSSGGNKGYYTTRDFNDGYETDHEMFVSEEYSYNVDNCSEEQIEKIRKTIREKNRS